MTNKNMTVKERNLLKGALRRVFSRSDLRRSIVELTRIDHVDPNRPRVKKWSVCPLCEQFVPTYLIEVDHTVPIIPLDKAMEDMSWDEVVNRIWCDAVNLMPICKECHLQKTKLEAKVRRENKKQRSPK